MRAGPGRVTVGVLGPTVAAVDGVPVDLSGPAPRRVLAVLAAARGQVVSVDRLIDAVWDGEPVPSAVGSLQAFVSVLRRGLEPSRAPRADPAVLVRSGPGYVLRVEAGDLDAERFTTAATAGGAALRRGEVRAAVDELDAALGLWRGEAYADCAEADFARAEVVRLSGLRLAAYEDRWAAALAVGDTARAAAELQALVAEHPLRENAAALLATALYRQGRQSAALEVLRDVRRALVDELGVDPGPALLRLEAQVLAQDPALAAPAPPQAAAAPRPAARALTTRRVPRPRTSLVAREGELRRVGELLDREPLVTLVGTAGVGKTRLAVEAARLRDDPDGPWVVELAGTSADADIVSAVAGTLSLQDVTSAEALAAALGERDTVLVLDNCEHLLDPVAGLVEQLLDACSGLRVLATSREPLGLAGEALVDVEPLAVEAGGVELLRQRLPAAGADAPPEVLARLVRSLDGLPLALELAAAQCRALSPTQVADLLHDRFALLRGSRAGDPRHRTLQDALAWSYDLLDAEQQAAFAALSVFRGPFDLSLAQSLVGEAQALAAVRGLTTKSLLTVVPGSSPRRYRLLESIREFGAAQLVNGQREAVDAAHLRAVTELAETADRRLRTADGPTWLARLDEVLPDVRAALAGTAAERDPALRLRLATAVGWFCYRRGHVAEGVGWLSLALDAAPDAAPLLRARALVCLAVVHYLTGEYTAGGELLGPARAAALQAGDPLTASNALSFSAYLRIFDGDLAAAEQTARDALEELAGLGEPAVRAEQTMLLAQVLRFSGRTDEALAALADAAATARAAGHLWVTGSAEWITCKVLSESGADDAAAARLPSLLRFWAQEGDTTSWLVAAMTLAGCLARQGDPERGAALLGAVAELGGRIGFDPLEMVQFGGPDDVESVRIRLDAETCAAAYLRGRAGAEQVLRAEAAAVPALAGPQ